MEEKSNSIMEIADLAADLQVQAINIANLSELATNHGLPSGENRENLLITAFSMIVEMADDLADSLTEIETMTRQLGAQNKKIEENNKDE